MKTCKTCLLPETHETISFNKKGNCSVCLNFDTKNNINWSKKKSDLNKIVKKYKKLQQNEEYDCIVPFSGGKDSTWTLYYLVKNLNLKPLVVRFDHGFFRPNLEDNVKKVSRNLGVDIQTYTPNWKVVQKLMLQSLIEKGDFCWHCHTGIFSYPMRIAVEKKIPLIIWGEPSSEYTAYYGYDTDEFVDEMRFNRFINLGINAEDMYLRLKGEVNKRDLKPFTYPSEKSLKDIQCLSICLGSYIKWDVQKQSQIIQKEIGWKGDEVENVPPYYKYEKIECYMQGVRDYLKYIKRGYSRPTHLAAIDLRNKRLNKKEAELMIKEFEGKRPPSLDIFLDFIGISEKKFLEIAISHEVSPNKHNLKLTQKGNKTKDFNLWSTDGAMDKKTANTILKNSRRYS